MNIKKVQNFLEITNLWPIRKLNLKYSKYKCCNYKVLPKYKIYIQGHKCDLCKIVTNYKISYSKIWKFDS